MFGNCRFEANGFSFEGVVEPGQHFYLDRTERWSDLNGKTSLAVIDLALHVEMRCIMGSLG